MPERVMMKITCWGSRGSIPVSGKEYLKYGGDTTCLEIRTKSDDIIIVDAGTGVRKLGNKLMEEERYEYHFIFTHAHWDHVMGFPFFKPIFSERAKLMAHKCPFHSQFVETVLSKKPACVIADMNGGGVHMSYEDFKDKGVQITGGITRFYGTHLFKEFESDSPHIRCAHVGEEIVID